MTMIGIGHVATIHSFLEDTTMVHENEVRDIRAKEP